MFSIKVTKTYKIFANHVFLFTKVIEAYRIFSNYVVKPRILTKVLSYIGLWSHYSYENDQVRCMQQQDIHIAQSATNEGHVMALSST